MRTRSSACAGVGMLLVACAGTVDSESGMTNSGPHVDAGVDSSGIAGSPVGGSSARASGGSDGGGSGGPAGGSGGTRASGGNTADGGRLEATGGSDAEQDGGNDASYALSCDELLARVDETMGPASGCDPALSTPQCRTTAPGTCCPVVLGTENSAESAAYRNAVDALNARSDDCFFDCPAVPCPDGPTHCESTPDGRGRCAVDDAAIECGDCTVVRGNAACEADEALVECFGANFDPVALAMQCRDLFTNIPRYCCPTSVTLSCE